MPNAVVRDLNAPEESVYKSQEPIKVRFVNASVLPRKAQNRNLLLGTSSQKIEARVLERRVLERKRNLYASRHAF